MWWESICPWLMISSVSCWISAALRLSRSELLPTSSPTRSVTNFRTLVRWLSPLRFIPKRLPLIHQVCVLGFAFSSSTQIACILHSTTGLVRKPLIMRSMLRRNHRDVGARRHHLDESADILAPMSSKKLGYLESPPGRKTGLNDLWQ